MREAFWLGLWAVALAAHFWILYMTVPIVSLLLIEKPSSFSLFPLPKQIAVYSKTWFGFGRRSWTLPGKFHPCKIAWFVFLPLPRHTVGQIKKECKETLNLMWLSLIWFILFLFVCWNLFCTITNLRIKCVTETKNVSVLFYKNLKSSFLHDSHIWLWGFFTLLVALAHAVSLPPGIPRPRVSEWWWGQAVAKYLL